MEVEEPLALEAARSYQAVELQAPRVARWILFHLWRWISLGHMCLTFSIVWYCKRCWKPLGHLFFEVVKYMKFTYLNSFGLLSCFVWMKFNLIAIFRDLLVDDCVLSSQVPSWVSEKPVSASFIAANDDVDYGRDPAKRYLGRWFQEFIQVGWFLKVLICHFFAWILFQWKRMEQSINPFIWTW